MDGESGTGRRPRGNTRAEIQRVALDLFTAKGYEATAMREIADTLGIRKASLYHHFKGKEDIVRSLFEQRGDEAEEFLAWMGDQPPAPELVRVAVLRWVDSFSSDKLRGLRCLAANPLLARSLDQGGGRRIGSALGAVIDTLAASLPKRTPVTEAQLRMALLSINAAVEATAGSGAEDEVVIAAARASALAIVDSLIPAETPVRAIK